MSITHHAQAQYFHWISAALVDFATPVLAYPLLMQMSNKQKIVQSIVVIRFFPYSFMFSR